MLSGLYLLLLLELHFTAGQTAESTLRDSEELLHWQNDTVPWSVNQTHRIPATHNSTAQPQPASHFSANGTFLTEEGGHNVTHEDEESFQDQERLHHYRHCNEALLLIYGEFCWKDMFDKDMAALGEENWCNWDLVVRQYSTLTYCLEESSAVSHCYYPGPVIQKLFVDIHEQYFSSCSTKDRAPLSVVLILTLLPVSIIPITVYLVTFKSILKD
ncbi:receptor activity-modifying protein 2-like [Hoplias malabaricus]|uniref:receptor activity-modifying protein 2-like n=1 Tax=Hoplias malabaricus TaxID=27720 RepID=UPI003463134E